MFTNHPGTRALTKTDGILPEILFGEGNVENAFMEFTSQHKCNKYCTWFELKEF